DAEEPSLHAEVDGAAALSRPGGLGAHRGVAGQPVGEGAGRDSGAVDAALLVEGLRLAVAEAVAEELGDRPRHVELGDDPDLADELSLALAALEELVLGKMEALEVHPALDVVVEKPAPVLVEIDGEFLDQREASHVPRLARARKVVPSGGPPYDRRMELVERRHRRSERIG